MSVEEYREYLKGQGVGKATVSGVNTGPAYIARVLLEKSKEGEVVEVKKGKRKRSGCRETASRNPHTVETGGSTPSPATRPHCEKCGGCGYTETVTNYPDYNVHDYIPCDCNGGLYAKTDNA